MAKKDYKISLITPTINRTKELEIFLQSLKSQTYKKFELIIIDQNVKINIDYIIEKYKYEYTIKHIKSKEKGISLNRNIGVKFAEGEILSFPDDDCRYRRDTLEKVNKFFNNNPNIQIYSCNVIDENKNMKFPMAKKSARITSWNYYNKAISIGLFIKFKKIEDIIFDNKLGAGTKFGSSEESDLVSSLLKIGYRGYYNASQYINHDLSKKKAKVRRYFYYGMGYGALYKKEILKRRKYYLALKYLLNIIKYIIGSVIPSSRKELFYASLIGKIKGFKDYIID